MYRIIPCFLVTSLLLLSACSTVKYVDATQQETVNTDFGSTDLQIIANKMVDELLAFPPMVNVTQQSRPVLFIDNIENKTSEHIDMQSITDSIQSKLIQSGKYRFVDPKALSQVKAQFNYQHHSGLVNKSTAVKMGKQVGAQYMLYGNMASITKQNNKTRDVFYKFTLKLMDLSSGILEWSAEEEIRKTRDRSWFGT